MATVEQYQASKRFVHELTAGGGYAPCEMSSNLPGFPVASVGEWIERAFESDEANRR